MSVFNASLKRVVLTLIAGAAIAAPMGAKANILDGVSVKLGGFFPSKEATRNITDTAAWGGSIDYKLPWFPKVLNGEYWSTSISAGLQYSERTSGILRYIPVSIDQVYTFEEQNGHTPYAGFSFLAATYGTTGVAPKQPMVTRFGAGLILGLNLNKSMFIEGRYDFVDSHGTTVSPEGFRGYVGYRF